MILRSGSTLLCALCYLIEFQIDAWDIVLSGVSVYINKNRAGYFLPFQDIC